MNTVRLKPETQERMRTLARKRGVSVSEIHRQAIESYLDSEVIEDSYGTKDTSYKSRWDKVIGVVEGVPDGSATVSQKFKEYIAKKHS